MPEHIWSTGEAAKDPVKFQDAKPVGTGPYEVNPCSANNIAYTANKHYWQPGLPKVQKVNYPAYTDNHAGQHDLAVGRGAVRRPVHPGHRQGLRLARQGEPPLLVPADDQRRALLQHGAPGHRQREVRQALAYAIDREQVSKIGESGYQPAANQSGVVLPTFEKWYDKDLAAKYDYKVDPDKAAGLLAERRLLADEAAEAQRHHHQRVHRLGRLAGRDQAAAGAARRRAHDRRPGR